MKMLDKIKKSPKTIFFLAALIVGIIYYIIIKTTGFTVPCFLWKTTGLYCPTCGITRMCLALAQLDFKTAFRENALLMILIPIWLLIAIFYNFEISEKSYHNKKLLNITFVISVILLIAFGIIRNIPYFSFLQPI